MLRNLSLYSSLCLTLYELTQPGHRDNGYILPIRIGSMCSLIIGRVLC